MLINKLLFNHNKIYKSVHSSTLYSIFQTTHILNQHLLTEADKKGVAHTVMSFIDNVFAGDKVKKEDILIRNIEFFKNPTCPEPILNQTIAKAIFSRMSWAKGLIAKTMGVSNQIIINDPKEKSDVRFIVEIALANQFAQQQTSVQSIMMNSENPNKVSKMTAVISKGGNKYKDILVSLKTNGIFELDIKSGNNAQEMFGGLLGSIHVTKNDTPYSIVRNKPISIVNLQKARVNYINNISQLTGNQTLERTSNTIRTVHNDITLDVIQRNINIQEQLFQLMSDNLLRQQSSFYVINRITETEVHFEFYRRLEPHINNEIFHNKQNANKFVRHAIIAYNDTIQNIVRNIKQKGAWEGTGFGEIAEELFNS